jgi:hypothetical protein
MPNQRQAEHQGKEQPQGTLTRKWLLVDILDPQGFQLILDIVSRLFLSQGGRAARGPCKGLSMRKSPRGKI